MPAQAPTIFRDLEPPAIGPCVVTIGNFDGVHRGHQTLLAQTIADAGERGVLSAVITFEPQPIELLRPDQAPPRLYRWPQKRAALAATGIDVIWAMPFDTELARIEPAPWVTDLVVAGLQPRRIIVGQDFRFGHRARGEVALLAALGEHHGFDVRVPDDIVDAEGLRISSTRIRERLQAGDFATATRLLGRPYQITGEVVRGQQRGRDLGFPTANLVTAGPPPPLEGVYAGWVDGPDFTRAPAVMSIGDAPMVDGNTFVVEPHLLDRNVDLYGAQITVQPGLLLRRLERFASWGDLQQQMKEDAAQARAWLDTT